MRDTRRTTHDRRYEDEEETPYYGETARSTYDRAPYRDDHFGESRYSRWERDQRASPADRGTSTDRGFAGRGPRTYRRSDDRIYDEVGDRLTRDPWIDASDVDVEVRDTVVYLRGTVDDRDAKRRAEDLVDSISGVSDVRNEIRVRDRAGDRWRTSAMTSGAIGTPTTDSDLWRRDETRGQRAKRGETEEKTTVIGVFRDTTAADRAINELKSLGFTREDISFVTKDRGFTSTADTGGTTGAETKGAGTGAILGGLGGGALGWLLGVGALTIPGVGPIVAAGALAATIAGAAAGAVAGGIVGALVGAGVPENEAKQYEKDVKEGRTLVAVTVFGDEEKDRAKDALHRLGGERIDDFRGERRDLTTTRSGNGHSREPMTR